MNYKDNRIVFFTTWVSGVFFYIFLDIRILHSADLLLVIFYMYVLSTIVTIVYDILTFDTFNLFNGKEAQKVFTEAEGDEKNQSLEEEQEESLSLWEWYDNFICYFHFRKGYSTNYNFDEYIKLKPILEKELEQERLQILGCLVISRIITHLAVLLGYILTIIMWLEEGYLGLLLGLLFPIGFWLVSIIFMYLLIYVLRHLFFIIGI